MHSGGAPPAGTVEAWAWQLLATTDPAAKLTPPAPPEAWEVDPPPRHVAAPGRPPAWRLLAKAPKSVRAGALQHERRRAQQLSTFLHHELQAAELMAWAILAFPDAPAAFRRGLLGICRDELRHLALYRERLRALGFEFGDFPLRDWFWQRVPRSRTPAEFLAVMGLGLEGGNLDHSRRFAERFRAAGDAEGAALQDLVCEEEVRHVQFAAEWFRRFTGSLEFGEWRRRLPEPLSPAMMHGRPLNRADRRRAGMSDAFLDELATWECP